MVSRFAAVMQAASSKFDAVFGEPVELIAPTVADSKYLHRDGSSVAPPRVVTGCFSDEPIVEVVKGSGANTHENTDVLGRRTTVDFDLALFASDPPPDKGWFVVATSQPRQPRYLISSAASDGVARLVCQIAFVDFDGP